MNPEELLKRLWPTQRSARRLAFNEAGLLLALREEEKRFRRGIFAADMGMVVVCCALLGVAAYLFYRATKEPLPQSGLPGPSLIWPGLILTLPLTGLTLFVAAARFRGRRRQPRPEDSVKVYAESLLVQIEQRIRLCKRVFWWFILPIIGIADFGLQLYMAVWVGSISERRPLALGTVLEALLECALFGAVVFYLFRWMIKKHLQPRQKELQALVESLGA